MNGAPLWLVSRVAVSHYGASSYYPLRVEGVFGEGGGRDRPPGSPFGWDVPDLRGDFDLSAAEITPEARAVLERQGHPFVTPAVTS